MLTRKLLPILLLIYSSISIFAQSETSHPTYEVTLGNIKGKLQNPGPKQFMAVKLTNKQLKTCGLDLIVSKPNAVVSDFKLSYAITGGDYDGPNSISGNKISGNYANLFQTITEGMIILESIHVKTGDATYKAPGIILYISDKYDTLKKKE